MESFERLVKIFVVVAGVLLIVGSIALVATIIVRGTNMSKSTTFEQTLALQGRVASIQAVGERLAVTIEQDHAHIVIFVDPSTGLETGRLTLQTAP